MEEIQISRLNKTYGDLVVFKDFCCTFDIHRFNCITGVSGGGKTTLLRIMMGLENYDGNITGLENKKFSCVFQENRLCENYTGIDNIKMILSKKIEENEILDELDKIGLLEYSKYPVLNYSGGMKRRLAIVRALLAEYDILILDEPFKELDKKTYEIVLDYVEEKTKGKTVILSTHSEDEVHRFSNKTIHLIKSE